MSKWKRKGVAIDHGLAQYKHETVEPVVRIPARYVQLGDTVQRRPRTFGPSKEEIPRLMTGEVVYIHLFGRFHTVEFRFLHGAAVRESFLGMER